MGAIFLALLAGLVTAGRHIQRPTIPVQAVVAVTMVVVRAFGQVEEVVPLTLALQQHLSPILKDTTLQEMGL